MLSATAKEKTPLTAELDRRLQITGTDIDRRSLETARAGDRS